MADFTLELHAKNLKEGISRKLPISRLHLSDFNVSAYDTKMANNIIYYDPLGYLVNLKVRGCVLPKKFRLGKRRKLKTNF
tara:strand:+ start:1285 stop:1524 length:240 start_codon:yes stop_codon:yes gene_type:complete